MPGEVVLIVHTGAPALRDALLATHVLPMAGLCIDKELVPLEMIEQGLFGVPFSHRLAQEFLSVSACAVHWGQANRHLVAERLLDLLGEYAIGARVGPARLLRHVGHCSHQVHPTPTGVAVVTARGIQPLTAHSAGRRVPAPSTFVTGGSHTHAYLVQPGFQADQHGGVCPHGTPQWEPAHTPVEIATSPLTDPETVRISNVVANTSPDNTRQHRHLVNLETTITALSSLQIAIPVARLNPLVNYREPRYD